MREPSRGVKLTGRGLYLTHEEWEELDRRARIDGLAYGMQLVRKLVRQALRVSEKEGFKVQKEDSNGIR